MVSKIKAMRIRRCCAEEKCTKTLSEKGLGEGQRKRKDRNG